MTWKLVLVVLSLLFVACASQDIPSDAPEVGKNGVVQVLSLERFGGYDNNIEVLVWRVVRNDGRECSEISFKHRLNHNVDLWYSVRHQLSSLPYALCLHVDVAGVER